MKTRTINRIIYAGLAVATMLAGYFFVKANKLRTELAEAGRQIRADKERESSMRSIHTIDSLMLAGNYSQAIAAYSDELDTNDPVRAGEIQLRLNLAEKLLVLGRKNEQNDSVGLQEIDIDSVKTNELASPQEIRQFDSLLFVLEKTKVQLAHMQKKLEQQASGTYLTITTKKGNVMHYVGEVKNGKAHGQGMAILNTGSRYIGEWKNNMRHGDGTFYWPDGEYYIGSYHNDSRQGQGTYFWPSGEKFTGQWKDDQRNGKGVFYGEEGEIVARGVWKNDELVTVNKSR